MIVAAPGGAEVRLRDLGKVTDVFELDEDKVLLGDRRAGLLQIEMTKNQDVIRVADGLGLDADKMASQLRAAFYGVTADEIQVGPASYEIDVRLKHDDQNSLADLEYFHFTLPDGKQVPLDAVAEVEQGRGWARIARVDAKRTVTVRGDIRCHGSRRGSAMNDRNCRP